MLKSKKARDGLFSVVYKRYVDMSRARKFRLLCAVALLSPWLTAAAIAQPPARVITDLDRIVAIVNDDIITETELNARLGLTKRQLAEEKIKPPADAILRRQLLDRMALDRLQLQLAE